MNKRDFWALMGCNLITVTLLLEHLSGLCLALEIMCIWTIISMLVHINILLDYIRIPVFVKEDFTK